MKKFLALVLVIAFAVAFVPATFAEEPAEFDRDAARQEKADLLDSAFVQEAIDNEGNIVKASDFGSAKVIDTANVSKKYQTLRASDLETKTGWLESPRMGVEMMDQENTLAGGYWFPYSDGCFELVNDWYIDGHEVYTQIIEPADSDPENENAVVHHQYAQGEEVWFNWELNKSFDFGSEILEKLPLDKNGKYSYSVSCYCYAGTYDEYASEDPEGGLKLVNAWMSGFGAISAKMIAPEDNYIYMFVMIVEDTSLTEFGSWLTISYTDAEFKDMPIGNEIKVGEAVTTDIGGADTKLVLAPIYAKYQLTNAAAYPIKLEGYKNYVLLMDSADAIGAHVFFCDENMDVLNETYVGSGAIANGAQYKQFPLAVMPPVTGTYYIVVAGFYMGDEGELEITVSNWNDVANPLVDTGSTINLDELGTEDYIYQVQGVNAWGFFWYPEVSLGELIILYPGTYTVTGANANVFVDVYDAVHVKLNNSTTGAVWAANTFAPATIEAVGSSTITDSYFNFAVYNYEGSNSGLYIIGEDLTVEGIGSGIITDATPVHIGTKSLTVATPGADNTYPTALWVTGKNNPQLTLAGDAQFDEGMQVATMYYDGNGYFIFGYTVATEPELYRHHNSPDFNAAALVFSLTTNGSFEDGGITPPPETKLGDVNLDDLVNTGDAVLVLRHVAELITLNGQAALNADVNQDGNINTGDAVKILRHVAGLELIED